MTVRERVQRTQRTLEGIVAISALLWAVAAALVVYSIASIGVALVGADGGPASGVLAMFAAVGAASFMLWRSRFVWMLDRVALWIEERAPELRYSLVTASDERYAASLDSIASPLMSRVETGRFIRRAAVQSLWIPIVAVIAAVAFLVLLPAQWTETFVRNGRNTIAGATNEAMLAGSKLTPLHAHIVAPAYTRIRGEDIDEPSTIAAVRGSSVLISGRGARDGMTAGLAYADGRRVSLPVAARGTQWMVRLTMSDSVPAVLELTDRSYKRSLVMNPRADAAPKAQLRLPARDTATRTAAGTLHLTADVSDDLGLGGGQFEYIVSSGAEETFTFKQGTLGAVRFDGARSGVLSFSVPFSFFKLGEGDRLSIRAVATDLNSLSGPGKGFSETRTIRVARKDEYDSLAVDAAAPSGDTALMSLRMLIVETERLDAARPKLVRDTLVTRSRTLARETDRVRAAVLPLEKEEGTGAPEITMDTETSNRGVQVTTPVRSALNDLEEASRTLDVADPHSALPPMYKAYKALQSLRNFKRYFFRGATRPVIVDIERVRLSGKTKGSATAMTPRSTATSDRDRMRMNYSAAIEAIVRDPKKATSLLTMVRVESLKTYPELSAALDEVLSALAKGRDATAALVRARRALEGAPPKTDTLPLWSGGW